MINVIFNDFNFEIAPKRLETYDKYCKILKWGRQNPTRFMETFMKLEFTDYQKYCFLGGWNASTCVYLMSRSSGKAEVLDTPVYKKIKTKNTHEKVIETVPLSEIKVGDVIYDADGELTEVIHLNPIIFEEVYEVEFDDGEIIECNGEHLWYVWDQGFDRHKKYGGDKWVLRTTDFMYHHLTRNSNGTDFRFKVPLAKAMEYPAVQYLPVHPYILGMWLGDGTTGQAEIACGTEDLDNTLENLRQVTETLCWRKEKNKNCYKIYINREKEMMQKYLTEDIPDKYKGIEKRNIKVKCFPSKIKNLGIYYDKRIPDVYLYASIEQRLELFQGLMDTDGTVDETGHCEFTQSKKDLFDDFVKLAESLGIYGTVMYKEHTNYIKKDGKEADTWRYYFVPPKGLNPFKLKRKAERVRADESVRGTDRKAIVDIRKTGKIKPMRCITVSNKSGLYLCGNHKTVTHNSYLIAPIMMARAILLPNTNTYIMAPKGPQAQETFSKMENLAKGNIASALGVTTFFLDECVRQTAKADPFTHNPNSYSVKLFNGSTINTLNSVAKQIVGIRSNHSVYDEAGKIDRDFYALTLPFSVQDTNFVTGGGIDTDLYPIQMPNKNTFLSSAEGIDSELYDRYKICFERMLCGDPNYFVADIDCTFSLHPFLNGKPTNPLVTQQTIDDAFKTNPFRARREYYNKFDQDGSQDSLVKRSTLIRYSQTYYPVFKNETKESKYIIAYDPSTKLDNSIIMIAELLHDEEKGYWVKFVNCINLLEVRPNGDKMVMQKPEQIEKLKDVICDYNLGALDYDNIDMIILDAGAGGGGTDIAQFLMKEWEGKDGKYHIGLIDKEDPYMKLREDDYPMNIEKLRMFNFKRDKVIAYERTQNAINQGLAIFPNNVNSRNELEFEVTDDDGGISIKYEKLSIQEINPLVQFDLAKEELVSTEKQKKLNGTIQFNISPEGKSNGMHDDRADCVAMILHRLMELRSNEALQIAEKNSAYQDMFEKAKRTIKKSDNPFKSSNNPFANRSGGGLFRR